MAYTPKTWTTGETIDKPELDAIEQGLAAAAAAADTANAGLAAKAPIASPTFTGTVSGVTKAMVGLGNVDNTADTAKPISTATQTALNAKLDVTTAASTYVAQSNAIDLEGVQDSVAGMFTGGTHSGISFAYDDPNGHINATVTGGGSGAGLPATVVNKTTAYTAAAGDFVQADATSAGFTVTLPASPAVGALVAVKKVDATANTLTIAPSGGGTIDGDPTATTTTKMAGAIFEHVGTNVWRIVASMTTTGPAGPTGATGATGPTGPGFVARGAWAPTTVYAINDIVTNSGSTYRSLAAHTSGASFSGVGTNWELWAAAGAQGTAGTGVPVGGTTGQILAKTSNTDYATGWIPAPTGGGGGGGAGDLRPRKVGWWGYTPFPSTPSQLALTLNTEYAARLILNPGQGISGLGCYVTAGGGAGATIRFGIRADDGSGLPGTLLLDAGTATATGTGPIQAPAFTAYTNSGTTTVQVWLVLAQQGGTAATIQMVVTDSFLADIVLSSTIAGFNNTPGWSSGATVSGALPSTPPTFGPGSMPKIFFKAA